MPTGMLEDVDIVGEGDVEDKEDVTCVCDEEVLVSGIAMEEVVEVRVVELSLDELVDDVEVGIGVVVRGLVGKYDVVVSSPLPTPSVNDPTGVSEMSERDVVVVADGLIYVCGVTTVETNGLLLLLGGWLFGSSVT